MYWEKEIPANCVFHKVIASGSDVKVDMCADLS